MRDNLTEPELRREFEKSALLRKTKVVLIDEGHHIALGRVKTLLQQLEVLKSLGNTSKIHLIVSGPYELLSKIDLNGQLHRRMSIIHFPRYKMTPTELSEFRDVLCDLVDDMAPWKFELDFDDIGVVEYFYVRSVGCIGILRPWLLRAVRNCARNGSWTVTKKHLDEEAKAGNALEVIVGEIEQGETKLEISQRDYSSVEQRLAMMDRRTSNGKTNGNGEPEAKGGKPPGKPGEAAPRRYPTEPSKSEGA